MNVALGFKPHSGWSALIVLGDAHGETRLIERRRVELVEAKDVSWAKQPYHAAEPMKPEPARELVQRAITAVHRMAVQQMEALVSSLRSAGHAVSGCAVLVGAPMPGWSVDEILAVHFRMHKAEGVLFGEALSHAAEAGGLPLLRVVEKELPATAAGYFGAGLEGVLAEMAALGKAAGPPWAKDQKDAALAAMMALRSRPSSMQSRTDAI